MDNHMMQRNVKHSIINCQLYSNQRLHLSIINKYFNVLNQKNIPEIVDKCKAVLSDFDYRFKNAPFYIKSSAIL
jgi:hypothetical protein